MKKFIKKINTTKINNTTNNILGSLADLISILKAKIVKDSKISKR